MINNMKTISGSTKHVPPEGGWGWMTVLSVVICNIAAVPPMTFFGFIFKGISDELHLPMMQIALIITTNISLGLILNVIIVPIIKKNTSCRRKIGFVGAIMVVLSYIGVAYSQQLLHVILSFSICMAIGVKLITTASNETMKSYFVKTRRKVNKITLLSTALGAIIMAQLMAYLLTVLNSRLTMLIISGVSLSLILAALFLSNVKFHLVEEIIDQEMETFVVPNHENNDGIKNGNSENKSRVNGIHKLTTSNDKIDKNEVKSLINSKNKYIIVPSRNINGKDKNFDIANISLSQENVEDTKTGEPKRRNIYVKLLTNPLYVCVAIGVILNTLAESLFGALLPFMLFQFKFSAMDVGTGIACFATAMVVMKYVAVYFRPKKNIPPRIVCILAIVFLIAARVGISLGFLSNYRNLLTAAIVIGSAKGFLLGYIEETITEIIPPEEEDHAMNIINFTSGILLFIIGPAAGYTRDFTGKYQTVMLGINGLNSAVILLWTIQLLLSACIELCKVTRNYHGRNSQNNNVTS